MCSHAGRKVVEDATVVRTVVKPFDTVQRRVNPPTEARPEGFEPPTNRVEAGRSIR